ncbi:MAG TPA: hypothetical protein VHX20_02600 [Terracidiphilus sp.]|jgi:adenosyl cobinamide kinase/adenosyl cobinamide phosphate guanylyltransferase|nr:hypothetical protein [Terracidiphilus sp.]
MRALKRLHARIQHIATGRRGDDGFREEIKSHIAAQTEAFVRAGIS